MMATLSFLIVGPQIGCNTLSTNGVIKSNLVLTHD
jgi:uncharacterized membrane protein YkgB